MKSKVSITKLVKGFSLHQSGTVMKYLLQFNNLDSSFSLHQSGTVMKLLTRWLKLSVVLVYIKAVR